ncbi:MAG: hypothetical protein QOD06_547 [Candidatus Binatota bacterium]|nr:hypothetical protein [Candidatus Binatota bacterium]
MASLLEEKDAIRELFARYCLLVDGARFEEWSELFSEDAVFEVPGVARLQGRTKILQFIRRIPLDERGLPGFKHCVLNEVIEVDGDQARAESSLVLLRNATPVHIEIAGRYHDELVREDGRWRFRSRTVAIELGSLGA